MTRVLLLSPESDIPNDISTIAPRIIIDLGRAPTSTYQEWSRKARCGVFSIFDLTQGIDDLYRTRELVESGMGAVVDRFGIDWWDVLVQSIVPQLQQLLLIRRLASKLTDRIELYSTRPHFLADALSAALGVRVVNLQDWRRRLLDRASHYASIFVGSERKQILQVLQDKFDRHHVLRSHFAKEVVESERPLVLLPSAYVNVSRTAVSYAELLPGCEFLLMIARQNGALQHLPPNVRTATLDAYFSAGDPREFGSLRNSWLELHKHLTSTVEEFVLADAAGLLAKTGDRLEWGIRVRDAWNNAFEKLNTTACLSADDSNPYSRLPLMLARKRGLPAIACHHGALDSRMAIKRSHADQYLAKSPMELDYLIRMCGQRGQQVVMGAPLSKQRAIAQMRRESRSRGWLVFFSEPFHVAGWRALEVYRELLPPLVRLAEQSGLDLVFKLHPFESVRGHRLMLRKLLGRADARHARILSGPITSELWERTACAVVVQSTVALDCAERGIPVFLCEWLSDKQAGYAAQYAKFGAGRMLKSVQELDDLPPHFAAIVSDRSPVSVWKEIEPRILQELLTGTYSRSVAVNA